jgi:hypothetical protein
METDFNTNPHGFAQKIKTISAGSREISVQRKNYGLKNFKVTNIVFSSSMWDKKS